MKRLLFILALIQLGAQPLWAQERKPIKPGPRDRCPVCGMFVAKYPDFMAEIVFKDGSYAVFDGVKDMMKYLFNLRRYNPPKTRADLDAVYVTDYYRLAFIDGLEAFYVAGSDIYGPMGRELIPFEKRPEAEAFMKDHGGKSLLRFGDIHVRTVEDLD